MTDQVQVPCDGLELAALFEIVQQGIEAEGLIKVVESVMDGYRDAVFLEMCKKQTTDKLHNLNSVCVALGMIHRTLKNRVTEKLVAEKDIKKREEE